MPTNPHKWTKNDSLSATRLNTMSDAIVELQKKLRTDEKTASGVVGNYTDNEGSMAEEPFHNIYDGDTKVVWRHPYWGTADLTGSDYTNTDSVGFYATPPRVQRADGLTQCAPDWSGCSAAPCKLEMPSGTQSGGCQYDTVYLKVITSNTGRPIAKPCYTFCLPGSSLNLYHIKGGEGLLAFPVAKIINNPQFPCEKFAMNNNGVNLPLVAADASYTVPYVEGTRQVQVERVADDLVDAVIPIRGIANHGGVKLSQDRSGILASDALTASIEMYGVAPGSSTDEEEPTYKYCIPVGSGGHKCGWLYQEYNKCLPYKNSGDGLLAKWRILAGNGECVGALKLNGEHLEDWQLAFSGEGEIQLPCVHNYYARSGSTIDYKYQFSTFEEGSKNYLVVEEYNRDECFGMDGRIFYDSWSGWSLAGTNKIELPGGGGGGCIIVDNSSTEDIKHEFSAYCDGSHSYLVVTEKSRKECFGKSSNGHVYDKWSCWTTVGSNTIDLGPVDPLTCVDGGYGIDYKYDFGTTKVAGKNYLLITENSRNECMYSEGSGVVNQWGEYTISGTQLIELPEAACVRVSTATTTDQRYEFNSRVQGCHRYLDIWTSERNECFGKDSSGYIYDKWTCWRTVGSKTIDLGSAGSISAYDGTAKDFKYSFGTGSTPQGAPAIVITEHTRYECFGMSGGVIADAWTDWQSSGTQLIEIPVGTPFHCLQIFTLPGTPAPGCFSRWCGSRLILVQQPIYASMFTPGPSLVKEGCVYGITGYKLV